MLRLLVGIALFGLVFGRHEEYAGNKVYKITPTKPEHFKVIEQAQQYMNGIDFWIRPSQGRDGYVMIPAAELSTFEALMNVASLPFEVEVPDVKSMMDFEDVELEKSSKNARFQRNGHLSYTMYHRYATIDNYMEWVASTNPEQIKIRLGGHSFEGRPIKYLRISSDDFQDQSKPTIVIDGGIHAREWISPPVVTFIIQKLVEDISGGDLVRDINWIIIPLVNPDGYEWSHTNARLWRKNRSTGHGIGSSCVGVDLNRNFDFHWMEAGSSSWCISETFAGSGPFSEPETQLVRDILLADLPRIKLYITMHSFGSMILHPWGHNSSDPSNVKQLNDVARISANAIDAVRAPGWPLYSVGNSVGLLNYAASGASEDYGLYIGIPLSYTYELPGIGRLFQTGFELPPAQINQVVTETWIGIIPVAREVIRLTRNGEI